MNAQERYAYWESILDHWRASGKPVASWCLENNINRNSFYKWRRIIHPEVDLVTGAIAGNHNDSCFFTPVVVVPQTRKISITINGAELTFDESLLSKVIVAIK